MGGGEARAPKRKRPEDNGENKRKRNKKYKQYVNQVSRRDLGKGSRGFVVTCNPKQEVHCFDEAVQLFDRFLDLDALIADANEKQNVDMTVGEGEAAKVAAKVENGTEEKDKAADSSSVGSTAAENNEISKTETKDDDTEGGKATDIASELAKELAVMRQPEMRIFERVDMKATGCTFVRVRNAHIDVEDVVLQVMEAARAAGEPGCRLCQRMLPIHSTCYASVTDAAAVAVEVAEKHFPEGNAKYSVQYRCRANTGAHRKDYIDAAAKAIKDRFGERFTVDLTEPDVVLLIEVVKTTCCIGTFRRFFELGKLNVHEAAKPPKAKKAKKSVANTNDAAVSAKGDDLKKETEETMKAGKVKEKTEQVKEEAEAAKEEVELTKEEAEASKKESEPGKEGAEPASAKEDSEPKT